MLRSLTAVPEGICPSSEVRSQNIYFLAIKNSFSVGSNYPMGLLPWSKVR